METQAEEAVKSGPPTGDELLTELRQDPSKARPYPEKVPLKLTLDEAGLLWEKTLKSLRDDTPKLTVEKVQRDDFVHPGLLVVPLDDCLETARCTTPSEVKGGRARFSEPTVTLYVKPNEAAYLRTLLKNNEADERRRKKTEEELFLPQEEAEKAEDGNEPEGPKRRFLTHIDRETPEADMRRAILKRALARLPKKLKMPAEDVAALLDALAESGGNVSKAARRISQPQRKTARRVERMIRHLKRLNLSI